ncbi:MAG: cell division protein ZapA [Bacteroidales bacterium]
MDKDKLLIHVEIAEKLYGIRIRRDEEGLARKAAEQIKNKIFQYRKTLAQSVTIRDLLAVVTLQLSLNNLQLEGKNDTAPFIDKIEQLIKELEAYLESK